MSRARAVVKGRSILALDLLGEIRRAMRILRRAEKYLVQQERRAARQARELVERAELRAIAAKARRS